MLIPKNRVSLSISATDPGGSPTTSTKELLNPQVHVGQSYIGGEYVTGNDNAAIFNFGVALNALTNNDLGTVYCSDQTNPVIDEG